MRLNKKGQLFPQPGNNDFLGKIEEWVNNHVIWFIVLVAVIIIAVLWSIQYLTCNAGLGGTCLHVACFGKFGIACG